MAYPIRASITPKAAAKIIISGELDLDEQWGIDEATLVLDEIAALQVSECLSVVDSHMHCKTADVKYIPQFGKIEKIMEVPLCFKEMGTSSVDYPQLGFFLKKDVMAKLDANTKFGENYGKGAAMLGLVNCKSNRIVPSCLTQAYCELPYDKQKNLIQKLYFRIPIIQILLSASKYGETNGFSPMTLLKESTKKRRGQSVRGILGVLKELGSSELTERIDKIIWETSEVEHEQT